MVMPYLRVANVQNGYVDLAEVKEIAVLESEVERYRLRAGDVLMNEGGDNDKLGRGTVWQAQIDPCLHQNHVFAIRPNGLLRAEWLAAFTQAEQARTYFYLNSKQSTNLASISASNVMSLALPIPSEKEQLEILTYLEADRSRHEELTAVAVSTVELLQERRSALISAAVTGKIDVRGWQPRSALKPRISRSRGRVMAGSKEAQLQQDIIAAMVAQGWLTGPASGYDRGTALYTEDFLGYFKEAWPERWDKFAKANPNNPEGVLVQKLVRELEQDGTLDVLRHGFKLPG